MKQVIKDLSSEKGMSMNQYFLYLVMKDQEGLFDSMQIAEKNREKILTIKGNSHDGYDVYLKDGRTYHCRTKLDVRKLFTQGLAQDI